MTVCTVIHQPPKVIFELFDPLILLGVGGRIVYHGGVDQAKEYSQKLNHVIPESKNLADWLINISTGQVGPSKTVEIENYAADKGLDDNDEVNEISSSSAPCRQSVFSPFLSIHGSAVVRKTV